MFSGIDRATFSIFSLIQSSKKPVPLNILFSIQAGVENPEGTG